MSEPEIVLKRYWSTDRDAFWRLDVGEQHMYLSDLEAFRVLAAFLTAKETGELP